MANEPKTQRWWQTVPGVLTALAAVITAVTGLIVAIQQFGDLNRPSLTAEPPVIQAAKPAVVGQSDPGPVQRPSVGTPPAPEQPIQLPDGPSVTMQGPAGDRFRYTIESAQHVPSPPGAALLRFQIQVWTDAPGGVNFWSDSFRLSAGGQRLKPLNPLNELVAKDETKTGTVEFEVDAALREATLDINVGGLSFSGNTRSLRLVLP